MSFNENVNRLLKEKGMTKATLAKSSGIPYTTLDSMLKRDSETSKLASIFKMAEALGTSVEKLVFDSQTAQDAISAEEKRILELYSLLDPRGRETALSLLEKEAEHSFSDNSRRRLDVYQAPAAAGEGLYIVTDEKSEEIFENVPAGASFAIKIKGDSMEPLIHDGETVFVKRSAVPLDGDVGIFILNGTSLCKRFVLKDKEAYLESVNPKYAPIHILETDELRFAGKIISEG